MSFSTISSGGNLFGVMFTANLSTIFVLKKSNLAVSGIYVGVK
jgi:hypothetical protein